MKIIRLSNLLTHNNKTALALQPAVWGIACLVLPFSCNDSNLYTSFSNNSKVTAVTHTKWINRNLFLKGN